MHEFSKWKSALQCATTGDEVRSVMARYVAAISPESKERLPALCQRVLLDIDISAGAVVFVREELNFEGDALIRDVLHEIAHTFVAAANRLVYLESSAPR